VIEENTRLEKEGLATTLWFNDQKEVRRAVEVFQKQADAYARVLVDEVKQSAAARLGKKSVAVPSSIVDKRVPVRLTRGPLDFGLPEAKLPEAERASSSAPYQLNGDVRFEIVNFLDGKRTISEVERALIGEFGRDAVLGFDRFIEDLVKVGVVRWK
jgi:hypothetical protein